MLSLDLGPANHKKQLVIFSQIDTLQGGWLGGWVGGWISLILEPHRLPVKAGVRAGADLVNSQQ